MSILVWIAGGLAAALLVYLVFALLLPEKLQ
ncbi:MAG: potassium-transporting ATPase subunit F [Deltaproteobacteria bacterium]|nr:potassium-transporting ATPase subunit F [Deltaproteobacteria bacterium]